MSRISAPGQQSGGRGECGRTERCSGDLLFDLKCWSSGGGKGIPYLNYTLRVQGKFSKCHPKSPVIPLTVFALISLHGDRGDLNFDHVRPRRLIRDWRLIGDWRLIFRSTSYAITPQTLSPPIHPPMNRAHAFHLLCMVYLVQRGVELGEYGEEGQEHGIPPVFCARRCRRVLFSPPAGLFACPSEWMDGLWE